MPPQKSAREPSNLAAGDYICSNVSPHAFNYQQYRDMDADLFDDGPAAESQARQLFMQRSNLSFSGTPTQSDLSSGSLLSDITSISDSFGSDIGSFLPAELRAATTTAYHPSVEQQINGAGDRFDRAADGQASTTKGRGIGVHELGQLGILDDPDVNPEGRTRGDAASLALFLSSLGRAPSPEQPSQHQTPEPGALVMLSPERAEPSLTRQASEARHAEQARFCEICVKSFATPGNLLRHQDSIHDGPITCDRCSALLSRRDKLRRHQRSRNCI